MFKNVPLKTAMFALRSLLKARICFRITAASFHFSMDKVKVREATPCDHEAILAIRKLHGGRDYLSDCYQDILKHQKGYVAVVNNEIVRQTHGCNFITELKFTFCFLWEIFSFGEARRLAREHLQFISQLKQKGVTYINILCLAIKLPVIRLHCFVNFINLLVKYQ